MIVLFRQGKMLAFPDAVAWKPQAGGVYLHDKSGAMVACLLDSAVAAIWPIGTKVEDLNEPANG